ncbi:MAG: ROK family protein, partial [Hominilimicola sp.]
TTLIKDGVQCSCGRKGCWEKYASATALVAQTKAAIKNNPESILSKETVINGQTAFRAADKGDETALKVVEKYIEYVAEGLVNVINIFQPKKVVIGGGISREGEPFISRVREFVYKYDYNKYLDKTEITAAELFNDAGIVGAALY